MKTLIAYASKYGTTEKCANILKTKLSGEVELHDLKEGIPAISEYDRIVIGGSIYAGQIRKEVTAFCKEKGNELKTKEIGLFIVCMRDGKMAQEQLRAVYPQDLLNHAKASGVFGGEFKFGKMSFFDKLITKVVAKTTEDVSNINCDNILSFAEILNV